MAKYTNNWLNASESPLQKKSRVTHLRSLLPRLGLVLLVGSIAVMMVARSAYGTIDAKKQVASGKGVITLADNQGTLTATLNSLVLSNATAGAHLVIHIHAKNTDAQKPGLCKGPVLFAIKATLGEEAKLQIGANGKFSAKNLKFTVNNDLTADQKALLNASDFNTWAVNVHNADNISPADNKPVSLVCGPIKAAANATKGTATLKPDPKSAPQKVIA